MNIDDYREYILAETMMGPNCVRILAELFEKYPLQVAFDDRILDLGCGECVIIVTRRNRPDKQRLRAA